MKTAFMAFFFFASVVLGHAESRHSASSHLKITPPLKDVASDKKFFGPPFPADYPDDKRPAVVKSILDKVKGPDQPYPALQSKADFDRDYVKDENSDKGAWQAQFEYDALRKKMAQEEADEKRAEDRAAREGRDVDGAQRADDEAASKVKDAQKDVDDAKAGEDSAKNAKDSDAGGAGGSPSTDSVEQMKKKVAEAEAKYEKAKANFEECKRQLEEAKASLEEAKAQMAALEKKLQSDTKLWTEQKTVKLNLKKAKKAKQEAARQEQEAKQKKAEQRLSEAEQVKANLEKTLAKEKAESEQAQKQLKKERMDMEQAKRDMDTAAVRLQRIHGYKPQLATPVKGGALAKSAFNVSLLLVSMVVALLLV